MSSLDEPSYRVRPVILLTFANDIYEPGAGYLRKLAAEQVALSDMLVEDGRARRYAVVVEQTLTRQRLRTLVERHREGIVGFHFGGHADSMALHLANLDGQPEALAADALADALATLPRLRWVCLNACVTEGHVDELHGALDAPLVVTDRAVRDDVARGFAVDFYRALIDGATMADAFAAARTRAAQAGGAEGLRLLRPGGLDGLGFAHGPPWRLVVHPSAPEADGWTLPGELATCGLAGRLAPNRRVRLPRNAVAQLLVARHQMVPFVGREAELAELDRWAADRESVRVRLVYGPGGAGKSRLLVEWLRRSAAAEGPRGFLRGRIDSATVAELGEAPAGIVVIDAAESRPGLAAALERLAQRWSAQALGRLRVILLAGNAGDWWDSLRRRSGDIEALLDDSPPPMALPDLVPAAGRTAEFERAWAAFAAVRRREGRPPPTPDLSDPRFGRVLYLHLAALAAVDGLPPEADVLLDSLLNEERRLWLDRAGIDRRDGDAVGGFLPAAEAFVGAVTLRGGVDDRPAAEALAGRFCGAGDAAARLVRQMRDLHFADDDWIGPLEPVLLGQALVAGLLDSRAWPDWVDDAVDAAPAAELTHGFTVLGRVEETRPEAARRAFSGVLNGGVTERALPAFDAVLALGRHTAYSRLGTLLAAALEREGTPTLAAQIAARMPLRSTMLREVALWVHRARVDEGPADGRPGRLTRLAGLLLEAGQVEQATARTVEALRLAARRGTALHEAGDAASPDDKAATVEHLGRGYRMLALCFEAGGELDRAVKVSEQAVREYRKLFPWRSTYAEGLAMALDAHGRLLARMGCAADAVACSEEAVSIGRTVAESIAAVAGRPALDTWLPQLTDWLSNHALHLAAVGRDADARAATNEVADAQRRLAAQNPDAHLPDLARTLNNLAATHQDAGLGEQALPLAREAVAIFERLAHDRPGVFGEALVAARDTLATVLGRAGAVDEALTVVRQAPSAAPVGRRAAARRHYNSGVLLNRLGMVDAALGPADAAVEGWRALHAQWPAACVLDLARALESAAQIRYARGETAAAIAQMSEAVTHFRAGHADRSGLDRQLMALSVRTLAGWQVIAHQLPAAAESATEAVSLSRALAAGEPTRYAALARALATQLTVARTLGDDATADGAAAQLVALGMLAERRAASDGSASEGSALPPGLGALALAHQGCRSLSEGRIEAGETALHEALLRAWSAFEASDGQDDTLAVILGWHAELDGPPDPVVQRYRSRRATAKGGEDGPG